MIFRLEDLVKEVRVAIDQNMESDALLSEEDIDTLGLEEVIRSKVPEAVRRVHCTAPVHLLELGHTFGEDVFRGSQGSGWTLLPDDFMRLVCFQMSDWDMPVTTAISTEDPLYALQRQPVKALRGTAAKPVCAIVQRPEGLALEFYSCRDDSAQVSRANYMPWPHVDAEGGIDISERCLEAVVYTAAELVMTSVGEADRAKTFDGLAQSLLGL